MRVLLVSVKSQKSYGGIATWTEYFLESCKVFGVDVDLVNTEVVGKRLESSMALISVIDESKRTKRVFGDLKSLIKSHSYDYSAVHLNTSCGPFGIFRDYLAAKMIKRKKLRLVTHYHCNIPDWIKKSSNKRVLKKLCQMSDENIVLCESSKKYLEENFGVLCTIIPNFVDDSIVLTDSKEINSELKTAVFVGRVSSSKGAKVLFELAKRFPNVTFELIGKLDDDMSKSIIPDNVKILGAMPHDEVINHLDGADVFVLPSRSEGFSLSLTEAMARGIPAVVTDVGANDDMLSDGCGIVTPVGDVDAMEKGLLELMSKEKRQEMSQKSVNKVRKNYVSSVVVNRILEIYN